MKCPRCQHENHGDAVFCQECGTRLEVACRSCGTPNQLGAKFCKKCGHQLSEPLAAQPVAGPRFGPPESYTPKHLAEKILTSKSALEGERKQVTVLFADLKGSMELLADRDPEEARKLLDPVLERMMEAVHRYEGTVNQVMGDGIMALFGAPLAHEDHAVRACYAALRMQESVKQYAEQVHRTSGVPLHIRIGVNSGEVVVRSIGSDLHMDYTAVGQTTHLAARLEQMAMPGSILITPETLLLAEGYVVVKSLGERPIKGLDAPIEVFEVGGVGTVRSRLQVAAARGLTRFVGRDPELEQLRQAIGRAGTGHGQVVAVVGEAGVGKSRLFWEFTHSHHTQGWLIIESSSVSYGKATAFLPLIELLRGYFQIEGRDDAQKIREKVTGKLLSLDRALEPSLPALLWLLDVPVDEPQWQRLDPPQRRQQTLDGIRRVLLRESQVQPLLLVFEDLHWFDVETQALLDSLVESLPTARLLLLVSYRPEYQHGWGSKTDYRQLRIDALPHESAEELLGSLLGNDLSLQPLKRLLIERTEGNPLFLEESVRTLIETRVLAGERGAYRLARAVSTFQIPATAQAILAARVDRLAPEDKRLLQAASVIGKNVPFALLEAIAERPEEELRRSVANLQAAELLYEVRLFPDIEYMFKHALTHDVAYQSLLQERKRTLHRQIVDTIERLHPDRLVEHMERLAHHALRGEAWGKAVTYLRQAGSRAFARSANRVAVQHLEAALQALTHLAPSEERTRVAIDVRLDLRHALTPLGLVQRTLDHLRAAQALAISLGDSAKLGWIVSFIANCLFLQGRYREALVMGEQALEIAEKQDDRALSIASQMYIARATLSCGEYETAIGLLSTVLGSLQERTFDDFLGLTVLPSAWVGSTRATALAELGRFAEADSQIRDAVRWADVSEQPDSILWAHRGLGLVALARGDADEAVRTFDRVLRLCRAHDLDAYESRVMAGLGIAKARTGAVTEGVSLLENAVALDSASEPRTTSSATVIALAEAYFHAGELTRGLATANEAVDRATEREEQGAAAYARWIVAMISLAASEDFSAAEMAFETAASIASDLRLKPLLAHCHLGLATVYVRQGRRGEAHDYHTRGRHLLTALGGRPWMRFEAP
jgi:class 3 adenylate cyclase/tetratricopeptide (TPR) repeat protein